MSAAVSWWEVHEYVGRVTSQIAGWPTAGTPEWCALPDGDERKLAAVLDAGQHHTLRMEIAQEARAEASKAVAGAADWPAIAAEQMKLANAAKSGARIERRAS